MTLLIDASPIVALADPDEPQRDAILGTLAEEPGALVIPAPTSAEIDYLLGRRFGPTARRAFLSDLAAGRFTVDSLERDDYVTVLDLVVHPGNPCPYASRVLPVYVHLNGRAVWL